MTTNNAINNTLASPFTVGATSVTSTGTQLNYLNALTAVPINKIVSQVFTTSGTYTPTSGMKYCIIECIGGGGGGGGAVNQATGGGGGGGGGAGNYSKKFSTAATVGVSQTVTIGAAGTNGAAGNNAGGNGGDTSVGSICIGKGGTGGSANNGSTAAGGAGGVAGTGDFTVVGQNGGFGAFTASSSINTPTNGAGGQATFGGGAGIQSLGTGTTLTGTTPTGYGCGGNGGLTFANGGNAAGGSGVAGIVVITEFVSS